MDHQFCSACGQKLTADARFCTRCGVALGNPSTMPGPGLSPESPVQPGAVPASDPVRQGSAPVAKAVSTSVAKPARAGWGGRLLVLLVGLLLILYAASSTALQFVGKPVTGEITRVERDYRTNSMDHIYTVSYSYRLASGKSYSGTYTLGQQFDQSKLPNVGSRISLLYLPAAPWMSEPANLPLPIIRVLVVGGLGLLLLYLAVSGRMRLSRR